MARPGPQSKRPGRALRRLLVTDALSSWVVPTVTLSIVAFVVLLNALDLLSSTVATVTATLSLLVLGAFAIATPLLDDSEAEHAIPSWCVVLGAVAWVGIIYYPFHCRIFPGAPLARIAIAANAVGTLLPLDGHGQRFDLVVDAHLPLASDQRDRTVHYDLDLVDDAGLHGRYESTLGDQWRSRRLGRRGRAPTHIEHLSTAHLVEDPSGGNLHVAHVDVSGEKGATLTGAVYAHRAPATWILAVAVALLALSALAFDLWRDPRATPITAAVTATAALAALLFVDSGAGHPSIRNLIGAGVLAALIGVIATTVAHRLARTVVRAPATRRARS